MDTPEVTPAMEAWAAQIAADVEIGREATLDPTANVPTDDELFEVGVLPPGFEPEPEPEEPYWPQDDSPVSIVEPEEA